jgi:epoxyqueuosine reductase
MLDSAAFVQSCLDAGFALAGVTAASPSPHVGSLETWLGTGMHGSMEWMARHASLRADPTTLLPGARSMICVADRYPPPSGELPTHHGQVAAYAKGRDYHRDMKRRLHRLCDQWTEAWPEASFRACVDTAPVLERSYAEAAGIGRIGKNTMLIDPAVGSWILLGEVLTTLDISSTPGTEEDPCGTCTRCIDACPTSAITPWKVDARRCISYLTIEHRGEISAELHENIGSWLFGCDVCQTVCPHNAPTTRTGEAVWNDAYTPRFTTFDVLGVLDWTAETRTAAIAGTSMTRATLDMIRRNACIVASNMLQQNEHTPLRERLLAISQDPDEPAIVRSAATAAVSDCSGC